MSDFHSRFSIDDQKEEQENAIYDFQIESQDNEMENKLAIVSSVRLLFLGLSDSKVVLLRPNT